MDYFIHFSTYHKIYLLTGAALILMLVLPTQKKISAKTRNGLYLALIIWIVCFAYKVNTGNDIIQLFDRNPDLGETTRSPGIKASPFNKYYSNDAGRNSKSR